MIEPFKDLIEVGSELLEHLKIKFDFKSVDDVPEALRTMFRKNLPPYLKLKKLLLNPMRDEKFREIGKATEALGGIKGPIRIVGGIEGVAAVEVEVNVPKAYETFY
jgi:hypothetical protein